jgi:hypothetical protein
MVNQIAKNLSKNLTKDIFVFLTNFATYSVDSLVLFDSIFLMRALLWLNL